MIIQKIKINKSKTVLIFILTVLFFLQLNTSHSKVLRLSIDEVIDVADLIYLGTVIDKEYNWSKNKKMIFTDYSINVEKVLKGNINEKFTNCRFAGGSIDSNSIKVEGIPKLEVGNQYIIFAHSEKNYLSNTVGWGQGIIKVNYLNSIFGKQTILTSYDGEIFELSSNEKIVRGEKVLIEDNKVIRTESKINQKTIENELQMKNPLVLDHNGKVINQKKKLIRSRSISNKQNLDNIP